MPYVLPANVRSVLSPEGAADTSTAAQLSNEALTDAIEDAQDEVDAVLSDRYAVPFPDATVPSFVRKVTRDIAAYLATLTHFRNESLEESHPVWLRYTRAAKLLERLASGQTDIAGQDEGRAEPAVYNPYDGQLFAARDLGLSA